MAIITDGDFTTAQTTGARRYNVPFLEEGDNVTKTFEQDYLVLPNYWKPSDLTDTLVVNGEVYHHVKETAPVDLGGVFKLTRTFAMVPAERTVPEQFAYTYRGLGSEQQYPLVAVASASNSGESTNITTSTAHSITTGDMVSIKTTLTQMPTGIQTDFSFRRQANSASGTSLTVDLVTAPGTLTYLTVRKVDDGRDPRTNVVPSFVAYEYFMVGESAGVSSIRDIPILEPDLITDSDGKETLIYTDTSLPARSSYLSLMKSKSLIVAEHSNLRRWMGNIYERSTRYVIAE